MLISNFLLRSTFFARGCSHNLNGTAIKQQPAAQMWFSQAEYGRHTQHALFTEVNIDFAEFHLLQRRTVPSVAFQWRKNEKWNVTWLVNLRSHCKTLDMYPILDHIQKRSGLDLKNSDLRCLDWFVSHMDKKSGLNHFCLHCECSLWNTFFFNELVK